MGYSTSARPCRTAGQSLPQMDARVVRVSTWPRSMDGLGMSISSTRPRRYDLNSTHLLLLFGSAKFRPVIAALTRSASQ